MNSEYASIEYSKDLAELFPDAEWWHCETGSIVRKIHRLHNLHYNPAITIQMALDILPKFIKIPYKRDNGTIQECILDLQITFNCGEGCYVDYEDWSVLDESNGSNDPQIRSSDITDKSLPNALAKMLIYLRKEGLL